MAVHLRLGWCCVDLHFWTVFRNTFLTNLVMANKNGQELDHTDLNQTR